MASTKLSALPLASALASLDRLYCTNSAASKAVTVKALGQSLAVPMGLVRNVKRDGALCDGSTDDTDSIQATIEAVRAAGGGVVELADGTSVIRIAKTASSTWKHALTIYPGIVIRGQSRERSVLKLISGAGNYNAIFSRALSSDADMNDVGLYDFTLDQNNDGNVPAGMGDLTNAGCPRYALVCFGGHRITVANCWFKGIKSINTLSFNAPYGQCTDVKVIGNMFDHAACATVDNDHSTIYTSASEVLIVQNRFRSPAPNTYGARTAIEMHGSQHTCAHNQIENFSIGLIVSGIAYQSDGFVVRGNIIKGSRYGILISSLFFAGNTTLPALTNCDIEGNQISIDRDPWTLSANIASGIFIDLTSDAPVRGLKIRNNQIHFAPTVLTNVSDIYSVGIGWERNSIGGIGYDTDIEISGNTITGSPASGMRIVANIVGLTISHNSIRNPGQSVNGTFTFADRCGIVAFPQSIQRDWYIHHNRFTDDQVTPTMTVGYFHGDTAAVNCRFEDNTWNVGAGHTWPVYYGSYIAGAGYYVRHTCAAYPVAILGEVKAGSSVLVTDTGTTEVQTILPQGSIYASTVATLFNPFVIPWGKIDGLGGLDSSSDLTANFVGTATLVLGGALPAAYWVRGPVDTFRGIYFMTDNLQRCTLSISGAEPGADVGGDLQVSMYTDAGAFIDAPLQIGRAAGSNITINRPINLLPGMVIKNNFAQVLGARQTGWVAATGTPTRTSFATGSVSLSDLAERVKALIDDMITHGLIGF
jgi:hypothetical protein